MPPDRLGGLKGICLSDVDCVCRAGKSTLLNVMAGWRFVQTQPDYDWEWEEKDGAPPLFEANESVESVTKECSFANIDWFGEKGKPLLVMDTPGHDDTAGRDLDDEEGPGVKG